jgi:hypothetical protein
MQKNDYETIETLILNMASNTHLNNNKKLNQWHEFTFESQTLKKMKSKPPLFFKFFGHHTDKLSRHYALSEEAERDTVSSSLYI